MATLQTRERLHLILANLSEFGLRGGIREIKCVPMIRMQNVSRVTIAPNDNTDALLSIGLTAGRGVLVHADAIVAAAQKGQTISQILLRCRLVQIAC
jgi:hypothetical protein